MTQHILDSKRIRHHADLSPLYKLSPLQTFQVQLRRSTILGLQIPVPNPMHPLAQLFRQLLRIVLNPRRAHREQHPRFTARLDDPLGPRSPYLIIGVEHVGELFVVRGGGRVREQVLEDKGILERLTCTLSLPGRRCVGGVAEQCDATFGVGGCQGVIEDRPFG